MWRHGRHYASERTGTVVPNDESLSRSSPRSRMVPCISKPAFSTYLHSEDLFGTTLGERHVLRRYTPLLFDLGPHTSVVYPVMLAFSIGQARSPQWFL